MIDINNEFLNGVAQYARYHNTPRQILILLDVPNEYWDVLLPEFEDLSKPIGLFYQKGMLNADNDRIDALDSMILNGDEGAGDAQRAIIYSQKKHTYAELKKKLFGV